MNAKTEYGLPGNKEGIGGGRIDVFCFDTNVAYEVTLSMSNLVDNALKCLHVFKVGNGLSNDRGINSAAQLIILAVFVGWCAHRMRIWNRNRNRR